MTTTTTTTSTITTTAAPRPLAFLYLCTTTICFGASLPRLPVFISRFLDAGFLTGYLRRFEDLFSFSLSRDAYSQRVRYATTSISIQHPARLSMRQLFNVLPPHTTPDYSHTPTPLIHERRTVSARRLGLYTTLRKKIDARPSVSVFPLSVRPRRKT
jgi:hypothetical protein